MDTGKKLGDRRADRPAITFGVGGGPRREVRDSQGAENSASSPTLRVGSFPKEETGALSQVGTMAGPGRRGSLDFLTKPEEPVAFVRGRREATDFPREGCDPTDHISSRLRQLRSSAPRGRPRRRPPHRAAECNVKIGLPFLRPNALRPVSSSTHRVVLHASLQAERNRPRGTGGSGDAPERNAGAPVLEGSCPWP